MEFTTIGMLIGKGLSVNRTKIYNHRYEKSSIIYVLPGNAADRLSNRTEGSQR